MGKFLKVFNNTVEYEEYKNSIDYHKPNVSYVPTESKTYFQGGLLFGYEGFIGSDGYSIATDGPFYTRKITF